MPLDARHQFALFYAKITSAGSPDPVTSLSRFTLARTGSPSRVFAFMAFQNEKIGKLSQKQT